MSNYTKDLGPLLTTGDISVLSGFCTRTIMRRYRLGLPPYPVAKLGGRLRFDREHVEAWLCGKVPDPQGAKRDARRASGRTRRGRART